MGWAKTVSIKFLLIHVLFISKSVKIYFLLPTVTTFPTPYSAPPAFAFTLQQKTAKALCESWKPQEG